MMNQREFFQSCREHEGRFDRGYRAVEGAVRRNSDETLNHLLVKTTFVDWIKRNYPIWSIAVKTEKTVGGIRIIPSSLMTGKQATVMRNLPKWYSPRVYTEVRIGKNVFDIVALTLDGAYVVEVADSESDESLKRKERNAVNLGFKFITVR